MRQFSLNTLTNKINDIMKIVHYKHFILASVVLSTVMFACTKDNDVDQDAPAYHIQQSEQLVIPAAIELPANAPSGNTRVATYYAEGVQKYKSQQKDGSVPATYEWVFVAPKADLYDVSNNKIGTHTAGPTWQLSAADSIYGQHFTPARTAPS